MSYPLKSITLPITNTLFLLSVKRILFFASYVKPNIVDTFILVHFDIVTSILNVLGRDCTKLPRIIKFSRHHHCLFRKYFLEKRELTRKDCKICFEEVKVERGSYSCVVSSCNYEVHVNCALDDKRLYEVIEEECRCEELNAATRSSITRVIEENEDGEATKIEHSSHESHCLVLADKMEEETDRQCDGCMLPVSTQLYYCSESDCHFCLHKSCAELPRIKQHWLRQSNATLQFEDLETCGLCDRICVQKLLISLKGKHTNTSFFFNFKCKQKKCNGCGSGWHWVGAFRCGKCSFALDFGCVTLPHSAPHKSDEHMLYLTYHNDNDYPNHRYCDICEGERDPSLWYYHCSICDTSAHPDCVLGNRPFVKNGATMWYYGRHDHELGFFRKATGYPECSDCGKLCQEEILKCAQPACNYIAHYRCRRFGEENF
ncbi:uncharacterized protein LOC120147084 [Hibiscus syriacus]|uniref:uncharacterized protein LOC120147084 n=1 Tax=Hibiscus syriacus TaxID=106335 RepID=UPI0019226E7C|nr:uncharacterized protein LOC120147084 [Hibiscus syriacus]